MKKDFLVVYDYGMGGVWSIFRARSKDEIEARYPELQVFDGRPAWMSDVEFAKIAGERVFDIDEEPSGWLCTLVAART